MNRLHLPSVFPARSGGRVRWKQRLLHLAAAAMGLAAQSSLRADVTNATWIGLGGDTSWTTTANWNANLIPNGVGASAHFSGGSGGPIVQLGSSTITLSSLELSDPLFSSLVGGTINLVGSAIVDADGSNFDLPDKVFPAFESSDPTNPRTGNNIGGTGTLAAAFIGSAGLNKTGDSHLQIDSPQFYTGTTSITGGGKIITTVGDSAFGNAANGISLNNGSIQVALSNWGSSANSVTRTINIGSLGGSIYWVDTGRSFDFSGNFTGASNATLNLNGRFGVFVGAATIRSSNSFAGTLNVAGGSVIFADNGAFLNVPIINNSGSLMLDNSNSGSSVNRIADTVPVVMRGASLSLKGGTNNYTETIGTTSLAGGVSFLTLEAGAGGVQLNAGTLTGVINSLQNNHAGLVIRATNLGNAPGPGNANVFINNGTSLLVKGLLPTVYVNNSYNSSTTTPESPNNLLATYGANGVMPITSYTVVNGASISGTNTSTNVQLTGNGSVSSTRFINALVIAAPATLQVAAGSPGITLASSAGNLNIDSGVVLSANAGYQTFGAGSILNSVTGNQINGALTFGTKEAIFMTPSALTINATISGTGGLTKLGARTATFLQNSSYTGTTTLTGFNRFVGDVLANGNNSVFGADTSPIVLYGGNSDPYNPVSNALNGTGMGVLGYANSGSAQFARQLNIFGDWVQLRDFGSLDLNTGILHTGTINWSGNIATSDPNSLLMFLTSTSTAHQIVSGAISGPGHVVIGAVDPNPNTPGDAQETWVDLKPSTGTNSFSGGLVISGGTVGIGSDFALGTGSVQLNGDGVITAINSTGSLNLANQLVIYNTTFGVVSNGTGTDHEVHLNGEINGRGGNYLANITNTQLTYFDGVMTGGGLFKIGSGSLILSNNNTFTGQLTVGDGTLAGGDLVITNSGALGSTAGSTAVETGQNSLVLDGRDVNVLDGQGNIISTHPNNLIIGQEQLFLRGLGVGSIGALVSIGGDNQWNGLVQPVVRYTGEGTASPVLDNTSTISAIRVDSGSTLSLNAGIIADDPGVLNNVGSTLFLANSIGVQKWGAGTLVLGSHVISTLDASNNPHNWNAALRATGTLDIEAGVVSIKSQSGVSTLSSGKSIVHIGGIKFGGSLNSPVGQLDLNDNELVIDYSGASPINTLRSYLHSGYNNGAWNGQGIISAKVASSPNDGEFGKTALAYGEASAMGITNYFGDPLDSTALILRYAYVGDADFNGRVDAHDLGLMALHWNSTGNWADGDFNYDGKVDMNDILLFSQNWQVGVGAPLGGDSLAEDLSSLGLPAVAIPEPAHLGLVVLVGVCAFGRFRRNIAPIFTNAGFHTRKSAQLSALLTDPSVLGHEFSMIIRKNAPRVGFVGAVNRDDVCAFLAVQQNFTAKTGADLPVRTKNEQNVESFEEFSLQGP